MVVSESTASLSEHESVRLQVWSRHVIQSLQHESECVSFYFLQFLMSIRQIISHLEAGIRSKSYFSKMWALPRMKESSYLSRTLLLPLNCVTLVISDSLEVDENRPRTQMLKQSTCTRLKVALFLRMKEKTHLCTGCSSECSKMSLSSCQISYSLKAAGDGNAARKPETQWGAQWGGGLFRHTSLKHE